MKQLETQLTESQLKGDDHARQVQELLSFKNRMHAEHSDMTRQLEDAESQMSVLNRLKSQLAQQVEELRRQLEQESRERQQLASQVRTTRGKTYKKFKKKLKKPQRLKFFKKILRERASRFRTINSNANSFVRRSTRSRMPNRSCNV